MRNEYLTALRSWKGYMEEENGNTCFGETYAIRHNNPAFKSADWCMMYLSENARICGIPTDVIPDTASCPTFESLMTMYRVGIGQADVGDIVVFMWKSNTDGKPDHVGVIDELLPNAWRILEGNHSAPGFSRPCVQNNRILSKDSEEVYCIIRPPYIETEDRDDLIRNTFHKLINLLEA